MMGEPSIDISITPPHMRSRRGATNHRHQGHAAFADILDHRQVSALGVSVVAVDIAAKDQTAFVGLADIEMTRPKGNDAGQDRFQTFRHKGLQHVAFDGQPHSGHPHHAA